MTSQFILVFSEAPMCRISRYDCTTCKARECTSHPPFQRTLLTELEISQSCIQGKLMRSRRSDLWTCVSERITNERMEHWSKSWIAIWARPYVYLCSDISDSPEQDHVAASAMRCPSIVRHLSGCGLGVTCIHLSSGQFFGAAVDPALAPNRWYSVPDMLGLVFSSAGDWVLHPSSPSIPGVVCKLSWVP
jgi:hypothetical protein